MGVELEQLAYELEHEQRVSLGLSFLLISCEGIVEQQGCIVLRYANSEDGPLFVGATEDRGPMKRFGQLYEHAFTVDNLHRAYLDARKHKRAKRACYEFECSLGANMKALHKELHSSTYQPKPYYTFTVYEPKERIIYAPAFRDCVVQHAIYRIVQPIFDRTFIDTSFACRPCKGTHSASNYTQNALRQYNGEDYLLQMDVRKFFYSIDRVILRLIVERKIKDKRLVDLMMRFADHGEPLGVPIGSLLSQIYALIYLNPLDHYVKRTLKVRHYVRYVDDLLLIGFTRTECVELRLRIIDFLRTKLGLQLSKSCIQKIKRGVNYVGYRTWRSKRFIRKHSLFRFRRAVNNGSKEIVVSLLGHAKHTHSLPYMLSSLQEMNNGLYRQIPARIRCVHHLRSSHTRT